MRTGTGRRRTIVLLLISAVLIAVLVVLAKPGRVLQGLDGGALLVLAAVAALYVGNGVLKALRWWILLRAAKIPATAGGAYRAFLIGMAFNNALPTGLAGEPVRLMLIEGRASRAGFATVAFDRALDAAVIAAVAAAGLPLVLSVAPNAKVLVLIGLCATAVALVAVLAWASRKGHVATFSAHPSVGASTAALTLLIQANDPLRLVLVARIYDGNVGFWRCAVIIAVATLAGLVVGLGAGAGTATTIAALLTASGLATGDAAAIALVFIATSAWLSIPLGLIAAAINRGRSPERGSHAAQRHPAGAR